MTKKITSIHYAAEMGETDALKHLIASGVEVDSRHNPIYSSPVDTPLFMAAWEQHVEAVEILLEHGANPDYQNPVGNSALGRAAGVGNLRMTNALLTAGANVDIKDRNGTTPLMMAAAGGHEDVVETLLAAGADVRVRTLSGKGATDYAQSSGHPGLARRLAHDAG